MKIFILMTLIISSVSAEAQLQKGHYSFVSRGFSKPQDAVFTGPGYEEICTADTNRQIGKKYLCFTLDVFDSNRIFLQISSFFDTGNTSSTQSGDYFVALVATGENRYTGKNKLIELTLISKNDEIEIQVHRRVVSIISKGIFNRIEKGMIIEGVCYSFKKDSADTKISASEAKSRFESIILNNLEINYGAYKVSDNQVVWEDISKWSSKEEVRKINDVAIKSFEVYTHNFVEFYVINTNSITTFPNGYTDYAKDLKRVYYQGEPIRGVSPTDFQVLDPLYAKTSKHVYYKSEAIPNVDVNTFESLNGGYARDKNLFYRNGQTVKKDKNIKELLLNKTGINEIR